MFLFLKSYPKLSIVVLAHNQKEYIGECINSILSQNIDKEIICVDDHSDDGTYEILCEYAEKYSEIKVYRNNKNLGTVISRYNGLLRCLGKYMMFVDADDKLLPDTLSNLYNEVIEKNVDILEFSSETDGNERLKKNLKRAAIFIQNNLLQAYQECRITNQLWNKLYSKKVYTKVVKKAYPKVKHMNYSDVVYFLIHFLQNAKSFASTETKGYFYYNNRGMTAKLKGVELLKQYCGFATTRNELIQTYGESQVLNDKWNVVCNQAVSTFINLSEEEQEKYKSLLYDLMSEQDAAFLIEGHKGLKNE